MYSVYFDWNPQDGRRLWHPVGLPSLTVDEARALAKAMSTALPQHAWGFGPTHQNGVMEVC